MMERTRAHTYVFILIICLSTSTHGCPENVLGRVNCRDKSLLAVPEHIPAQTVTGGTTFPTVTLDLQFNSISLLEHGAFSNLTSLLTLNIYNNKIASIQPGAFTGLGNVTRLDLTSNQLDSLTVGMLSGLRAVEYLAFSYNDIAYMSENILDGFPQLEVLKLGSNKLTSLPSFATSPLENLEQLYLQYNNLSLVPSRTLNQLPNLKTLDLSGNPLTHIITEPFAGVPLLQSLQLNDIQTELTSHFPAAILTGLQKLTILEMDSNSMVAIPSNLSTYVPNLEQLSLRRNNLTQIPNHVFSSGLLNLTHLDFWFNSIKTIDIDAFSGLPMLNNLILSDNLLSTIPEGTFEYITHDAFVYLDNNPFSCDCRLVWLKDWLESSSVHRIFYPTCDKPSALENQIIPDIPSENLTCVAPNIMQVTNTSSWTGVGEGTVTLHCDTTGFPVPDVTWTLPDGKRQDGNTIHLTTSPESEGIYTCQASNPGGNDTLSIVLNIPSLSLPNDGIQSTTEVTSASTFSDLSPTPLGNVQNVSIGSIPIVGIIFGSLACLIMVILIILAFTCHKGQCHRQTLGLHQREKKDRKAGQDQVEVIALEDVEITPTGEENIYSTAEDLICPADHSLDRGPKGNLSTAGRRAPMEMTVQAGATDKDCASDHHYEVPSSFNHSRATYEHAAGQDKRVVQPCYKSPPDHQALCHSAVPMTTNPTGPFRSILSSPIDHNNRTGSQQAGYPPSPPHGKMAIPNYYQDRPNLSARRFRMPSKNGSMQSTLSHQSGSVQAPAYNYHSESIDENIQEHHSGVDGTSNTPFATRYTGTIPPGYHSVAQESATWPKRQYPKHREDFGGNMLSGRGRDRHGMQDITIPGSCHYSPSTQNRQHSQRYKHQQRTPNMAGGLATQARPIPTGNAPRKPVHPNTKFRVMAHMLTNTEGGRKIVGNPSQHSSNSHYPDGANPPVSMATGETSKTATKDRPNPRGANKSTERQKAQDQSKLHREREPLPAGLVMSIAKNVTSSNRTESQMSKSSLKSNKLEKPRSQSKPWY